MKIDKKKKIKEEKNYIKVETSYKKICTRWIRFLIFFCKNPYGQHSKQSTHIAKIIVVNL